MTSAIAIASVSCTSVTAARIEIERSSSVSIWIDGGTCARMAGSALRTRSTTCDRVGVGLALDREHDGALVVEPARDLVVLDAVDDAGDLVELDRRAVALGHDDVAVVRRMRHRAGGGQRHVLLRSGQDADRRVGIGLGNDGADVVERDVARGRRHRIDLDANGEFLRAVDQHLRDARKLRNLLAPARSRRIRRRSTAASVASSG